MNMPRQRWIRFCLMANLIAVLFIGGCAGGSIGPQVNNVTVIIDDGPTPEVVVISEVNQYQEAVDLNAFHDHHLVTASLQRIPSGHFVSEMPKLAMSSLFLPAGGISNRQEFRWTIYAPGYVVTTIDPSAYRLRVKAGEKLTILSGVAKVTMSRVEVSRRHGLISSDMEGRVMRARSVATDPAGRVIRKQGEDMIVRLRRLKPEGAYVRKHLSGKPTEDELTDHDALTFWVQCKELYIALKKIRTRKIDARSKQLIWNTIDQQYQALVKAGFSDLIPEKTGEIMTRLRLLLENKLD